MASDCERILREYKEADFYRRLHIYLEYPPLRREFGDIDRNDAKLGTRADATWREVKPQGLFGSIADGV